MSKALMHDGWRKAMEEKMLAFEHNNTLDLVDLPGDKKAICCKMCFRSESES